jgi:flagellar biosynthesis protein FliR
MNDLIPLLTEMSGLARENALNGLMVFLRVGAMLLLLPAFGEQAVPQRIKLAVALAFTVIVTPAVTDILPQTDPFPMAAFLTEVVAGLIIGFGLRLFIHALQIAGAIAAQATTLSQMFGGAGPEPQPAIGNVLVIAGLAAAVSAGLHIRIAELLILSYGPLPAGVLPQMADVVTLGADQIAAAFSLGFALAAPFVIASVLYNIALGFINRAMPQLAVSFVGAPALTLGGLALLAVTAPFLIRFWLHGLNAHLANPFVVHP